MAELSKALVTAVQSLLGVSEYQQATPATFAAPDDALVDVIRKMRGGVLQTLPQTRTRWYLKDIETAERLADTGDLALVGQLWRAMRKDGMINGLTKTRTAGLVALPKRFKGGRQIIKDLQSEGGTRSVFDEMFPPSELALLAADGIGVGVGLGELVPVVGREYPVLVRQDPEFLRYRWDVGRWFFRSIAGLIPINPGDGRWVLHTPGGRMSPWQFGVWRSLGRAYVDKDHARLHRSNYSAKLANPARVAHAPQGATEAQRLGFLSQLMAWGVNTVFELPPGWQAELLESNGRGHDVFKSEIETSDLETMIELAGQVVTVTGGTGFANADIHKTIRADLIKETADALAYTLNTQGIPQFVVRRYGVEALQETARVGWVIEPPKDRKQEGDAIKSLADAIKGMREALAAEGRALDIDDLLSRFELPVKKVQAAKVLESVQQTATAAEPPAEQTDDNEED